MDISKRSDTFSCLHSLHSSSFLTCTRRLCLASALRWYYHGCGEPIFLLFPALALSHKIVIGCQLEATTINYWELPVLIFFWNLFTLRSLLHVERNSLAHGCVWWTSRADDDEGDFGSDRQQQQSQQSSSHPLRLCSTTFFNAFMADQQQ